jgi:hypothetical protein
MTPRLEHLAWIPESPGPLLVESLQSDRLLPPIDTLLTEGALG